MGLGKWISKGVPCWSSVLAECAPTLFRNMRMHASDLDGSGSGSGFLSYLTLRCGALCRVGYIENRAGAARLLVFIFILFPFYLFIISFSFAVFLGSSHITNERLFSCFLIPISIFLFLFLIKGRARVSRSFYVSHGVIGLSQQHSLSCFVL